MLLQMALFQSFLCLGLLFVLIWFILWYVNFTWMRKCTCRKRPTRIYSMGWLFSGGSSVPCDLPEVSAVFSSEFSWGWATQTDFHLPGPPSRDSHVVWASSLRAGSFQEDEAEAEKPRSRGRRTHSASQWEGQLVPPGRGNRMESS